MNKEDGPYKLVITDAEGDQVEFTQYTKAFLLRMRGREVLIEPDDAAALVAFLSRKLEP